MTPYRIVEVARMRSFGSSLEQISNKLLSAQAAVEVVKPGHRVFVGTACATPTILVEALERARLTSSSSIS
jgi:acyl-CoA hydrolase